MHMHCTILHICHLPSRQMGSHRKKLNSLEPLNKKDAHITKIIKKIHKIKKKGKKKYVLKH